jgi:hypothetical protein
MNRDGSSANSYNNYCGGIIGFIFGTNLNSCTYTGNIEIPVTYAASGLTFIGGVLGLFASGSYSPVAENCTASGDIRCEGSETGNVYLGGVAAYIFGSGDSNRVKLKSCTYRDGNISLVAKGNTLGYSRIGGLVGMVLRHGEIENCASLAGSVSAYHTVGGQEIMIGGFAGQLIQINITDCYSTSPVSVPADHKGDALINIGGFGGYLLSIEGTASNMKNCYAVGPVTSYGGGAQYSGGLLGRAYIYEDIYDGYQANSIARCYATGAVSAVNRSNLPTANAFSTGGLVGSADATNISECYATGAVSAQKSNGTARVNAGGLAGFLGRYNSAVSDVYTATERSSVTNCYALGNVFADNPNSAVAGVYAGGLVGYAQIASGGANPDAGKVAYNFATGSVRAQSAGSGIIYAGGIVGYKASGDLTHNAALGDSVTATGGNDRYVARVYARPTSGGGSANYAVDSMRIEKSSAYDATYIAPDDEAVSDNGTSQHGARANGSTFRNPAFWTTTLGFGSAEWNFGSVVSRGHPALKNVVNAGGQ